MVFQQQFEFSLFFDLISLGKFSPRTKKKKKKYTEHEKIPQLGGNKNRCCLVVPLFFQF
jgi:hypothetical protein